MPCRPQVECERKEAEAIRATVIKEEAEVKVQQAETQLLKDDAQAELEEVCSDRRCGLLVPVHFMRCLGSDINTCNPVGPVSFQGAAGA
eukprot:293804-Chlamydomonas_euryale.AAC.3